MKPRTQAMVAMAVLLAGLAGMGISGWYWAQARATNALIAAGDPEAIGAQAAPAARFAKAYWLRRSGGAQTAAGIYQDIITANHGPLRIAAHFNLANLHFLLAAKAIDETRLRDMVPHALQARAHYRRVLFLDSGHYGAKYNLEYVERLLQGREWLGSQTEVGASPAPTEGGTAWVSVHELPEGLP